jgi:hypothetical protein
VADLITEELVECVIFEYEQGKERLAKNPELRFDRDAPWYRGRFWDFWENRSLADLLNNRLQDFLTSDDVRQEFERFSHDVRKATMPRLAAAFRFETVAELIASRAEQVTS